MGATRNYPLMTIILCWTGLVVMSSLYVTIPLTTLFAQLFEISTTNAAAAGSTFSIGFAIGCLIYGALSDKYGRKTVIFVGLLFLTLISLTLGTVHSFAWILVLRGLQGAAAATFSPVALAYAVEMYPAEKRVTTIGFISTGFLIAGIVGQVISSMLSEHYGWNAVFYILAVVYAVTATLVFFFLPKGGIQQAHANIWEPIKQIGKVFVQKQLVLCYLVAFVLLMSFVSMYTVLGNYLSTAPYELSKQEILSVRFIGILGMLVSPFAGRISKHVGVGITLRGGLLLAIIGLASMGMISNLPLLIVMSILFVGGIALAVPSLVSLVSLVGQVGGKMRGIAVSVYTFILFTGTSFGPIISLQLMNNASYLITFLLLACILSIGLLAACLIRHEAGELNNQ
ncbi:MFS transporter [Paenibacillus solani]|uniref:MFS transporter n=2 Tax=Paenibacillus solani TaxID=1705565 RepID=A0A0M1P8N0_9BACL|nr:MFS transporter [Paenibacillus solani]